jgi:hypothetical protein
MQLSISGKGGAGQSSNGLRTRSARRESYRGMWFAIPQPANRGLYLHGRQWVAIGRLHRRGATTGRNQVSMVSVFVGELYQPADHRTFERQYFLPKLYVMWTTALRRNISEDSLTNVAGN